MLWVIVQNLIRFSLEAAALEKRIVMIEGVFSEIAVKGNAVSSRLLLAKKGLVESLREQQENYVGRNIKQFAKRRFVNHMGSKVFGEMWYNFKYGFVDNFFWDHPLLEALARRDKESTSFALQWMTIYKLPPEVRVVIKSFMKSNKTIKKLEEYNNRYEALYDGLFTKFQKYQGRVIKGEEDRNNVLREIEVGFEDIQKHKVKYEKLTVQATKELIQHSLSFDRNNNVETYALFMKLILDDNPRDLVEKVLILLEEQFYKNQKNISLGYFLSMYGVVGKASFKPRSPQTGNFYFAEYIYSGRSLRLYINNVWYSHSKNFYDFPMGVGKAQSLALSPNFGKRYNKSVPHTKVSRPYKAYKSRNLNGTKS